MKKVNIAEAKALLSELVEAVEQGGRVVICRRNRPIAELVRAIPGRTSARPIGTARGRLQVPQTFFDPLPDDLVDSFYPAESMPGAAMVADRTTDSWAGGAPRVKKGTRA